MKWIGLGICFLGVGMTAFAPINGGVTGIGFMCLVAVAFFMAYAQ